MLTTDDSATLISPRSIAMKYRKLWAVGVAFVLLAGFIMLLAVNRSYHLYQEFSENVHLHAKVAAQSAARQVSADLDRRFNTLHYISNALLPAGMQLSSTTLEQIQIIPALRAIVNFGV